MSWTLKWSLKSYSGFVPAGRAPASGVRVSLCLRLDSRPKPCRNSVSDWRSVSVGQWKITIAHGLQPSHEKGRPGMLDYLEDGGTNVHVSLQKSDMEDLAGCYLVVHNQNQPYELNMMFPFTEIGSGTNEASFSGLGIQYHSHGSLKMLGCASNDQTRITEVLGYKTLFVKISHTVDRPQDFWTLMINLWYPIINCAVLPSIFGANKLFAKLRPKS